MENDKVDAENDKVVYVKGYLCTYCGDIYDTKEEALQCWERHVTYIMIPRYVGTEEYPVDIEVRRREKDRFTEVATYTLSKKEKVDLPAKGGYGDE